MSTAPAAELRLPVRLSAFWQRPAGRAAIAACLAVLGITAIWPTAIFLVALWTTDPLKSVGMLIPVVCLLLVLRVWRQLRWEMQGTWWGASVLALTVLAVHLREQAVLVLVLPRWSIYFPPHSLVAFAYVAGVVLLFGGTRLFRAALFPISLIWLVNPVPHIFNVLVDLPLQRVSAHVARAFAMALGQKLTPDQMRLMFTPDFGMFIAPGCNGIRGAVTMGLIALVVGYIYKFRHGAHAMFVTGAVLLGYLFNFVRLCTLVLYYIVALHFTWLQDHGEMADYIIGACLFLFGTYLLISVVKKLGRLDIEAPIAATIQDTVLTPASSAENGRSFRLAAMLAVVLVGFAGIVRAYISGHRQPVSQQIDQPAFPTQVGAYRVVRSWDEYATAGPIIFRWADYAPAAGAGIHIALGISPVLGSHDTMICHSARGEDPLWHAQFTTPTANTSASDFNASFFNDGATQYLEVTTVCNGSSCGEYSTVPNRIGFVFSRPSPSALFSHDSARPIPVMLRAETIDTTMPAEVARQQLTASMRSFLSQLDLPQITQPYHVR